MKHGRDTSGASDTVHVRLRPEDRARLNELCVALTAEFGQPSAASVIRLALKDLHAKHTQKETQ